MATIKLIIAEDETPIREGLRKIIPWNEYNIDQIYTAKDGQEAYELCRKYHPDILFTDIQMPHMNGVDLAEAVRKLLPDVHIIFFSSHSDKEYLKSAIRLRAVSYIEKPLVREEILDALQEIADLDAYKTANLGAALRPALFRNAARGAPLPEIFMRTPAFSMHECSNYRVLFVVPPMVADLKIYAVSEFIEKKLREYFHNTFVTFQENKFCIFMWYNDELTDGDFDVIIRELFALLSQECMLDECFCACGNAVQTLEQLPESYASAVQASAALFFTGFGEQISHYSRSKSDMTVLPDSIEESFDRLLQKQEYGEMQELLSSFADDVKKLCPTEANVKLVKKTVFRLYVILNRRIEDDRISAWTMPPSVDLHAGMAAQTFDELFDRLMTAVESFFDAANSNKQNPTVSVVSKFIEENYANPDLSVESIAMAVHLSPNYISHLFKKELDDSPSAYINRVRVEKAKALLKNGSRTLSDIAASVGYSDPNYFMRIFKRLTGTTPSDYRRKQ